MDVEVFEFFECFLFFSLSNPLVQQIPEQYFGTVRETETERDRQTERDRKRQKERDTHTER